MAIKINGTTVIDDSRNLNNIVGLDATTISTIESNIAAGMEVIASGVDTVGADAAAIEVTGLETYSYVVGFLMGRTTSSSDTLYLSISIDNGAYQSVQGSGSTAGASDTYVSQFTAHPKPLNGYVQISGSAHETTSAWASTGLEASTSNVETVLSAPASTGITKIRWSISGGAVDYYRYCVMGIK